MKNGIRIIDAHCHVYPDKILPAGTVATARFYGENAAHSGSVSELLNSGTDAGIDRFIIQSVATKPEQVHNINTFISKQCKLRPDRFTGLGTVHPLSTDTESELDEMLLLGLRGVKIHPDIQGFPVDHDGFRVMYEYCQKHNLPVLIHTGDKRYDFSNPNRLIPLLADYPDLTFVGAHLGGWSMWEEASDRLWSIPNLVVDCSSSLGYVSPEIAKSAIMRYGADRVMFGTDYPLHNVKSEIDMLFALGFSERENRLILSENAERIYGIKAL